MLRSPFARSITHRIRLAPLLLALPTLGTDSVLRLRTTSGQLVSAAPMAVERAGHTATTLPDGSVLILGGFGGEQRADRSAERFDPSVGRFVAMPRMVQPRHSHTSTTLPDGRILIAGGYGAGGEVTSAAELFDPATNSFTAARSMLAARAGHVAVLLPNGKVLLAGGVGQGWSFLASAELYDPTTGTFAPTGTMTVARESHVAVRLDDGRALIVGGHRDRRENIVIHASAEVYDAARGTFRRVGDMAVRRHKHDAVRLRDGRVLVTGGSDERDDKGAYNSTEYFDPATDTFRTGPAMTVARYKHHGSALLLDSGDVLITGGATRAELLDVRAQRFTPVTGDASLAGLFGAAARLGRSGALITGGYGHGTGPRASAWIYR